MRATRLHRPAIGPGVRTGASWRARPAFQLTAEISDLKRKLAGAAAWPLSASAQPRGGKIVTIGIPASEPWPPIDTFRQALDDLGYIEGKNVRFEYRYTKGHNKRLPELATDLVRRIHKYMLEIENVTGHPR